MKFLTTLASKRGQNALLVPQITWQKGFRTKGVHTACEYTDLCQPTVASQCSSVIIINKWWALHERTKKKITKKTKPCLFVRTSWWAGSVATCQDRFQRHNCELYQCSVWFHTPRRNESQTTRHRRRRYRACGRKGEWIKREKRHGDEEREEETEGKGGGGEAQDTG